MTLTGERLDGLPPVNCGSRLDFLVAVEKERFPDSYVVGEHRIEPCFDCRVLRGRGKQVKTVATPGRYRPWRRAQRAAQGTFRSSGAQRHPLRPVPIRARETTCPGWARAKSTAVTPPSEEPTSITRRRHLWGYEIESPQWQG